MAGAGGPGGVQGGSMQMPAWMGGTQSQMPQSGTDWASYMANPQPAPAPAPAPAVDHTIRSAPGQLYVPPPPVVSTKIVTPPVTRPTQPTSQAGTRSQLGPARQVGNTWTTFPQNHPDAPDYNGQNPGDWAAWTNGYVPAGQKVQFKGTAKKGKK